MAEEPSAGAAGLSRSAEKAAASAEHSTRKLARHRRPPQGTPVSLLGVDYLHQKTADGGDLYLTEFGQPFWEHLQPEHWHTREWLETKGRRLVGTSTVYQLPTRRFHGISLHLVVKYSRVGEAVPVDTFTISQFINAEFNSPFEEFSLLIELRAGQYGPPGITLRAQKPLAIFVPSKKLQLWQTGRSEDKIEAKLTQHPSVELDILRQYVLIYGWIDGLDIVEMSDHLGLKDAAREQWLARFTSLAIHELELKGYRVMDMKAAHVIVRPRPDGTLLRDRHGQVVYAVVDYELLARTPEHEQAVRGAHRQMYLQHVARRFEVPSGHPLPPHLRPTNLLGVDYVFGHAESTGGLLWVVGKDPDLFNYFLPERWRRTPKLPLSPTHPVFCTCTKDNINLVWRVSRLGDSPWLPGGHPREILNDGFNSPFEEFAWALTLSRAGVKTVYPRAIYMTGHHLHHHRVIADQRRFRLLAPLRTPEGEPVLRADHDYITIWGFWNGPDELLAAHDGQYYRCVNARQACGEQALTEATVVELLRDTQQRLAECGFVHLDLKAEHLLVSFASNQEMVRDARGQPEVRLCNFELIRPLPPSAPVPPTSPTPP